MKHTTIGPGDIVQLGPNTGPFKFCFMVVEEVKPWGVAGYVQSPGSDGQAFFRARWENFESTGGKVVWMAQGPESIA